MFAAINAMLNQITCDRSAIDEKLGSSCDNRENIIMAYLGLVEHRTNELLTIQSFINAKVTLCFPFIMAAGVLTGCMCVSCFFCLLLLFICNSLSQDLEKEYSAMATACHLLGKSPPLSQQDLAIRPPASWYVVTTVWVWVYGITFKSKSYVLYEHLS